MNRQKLYRAGLEAAMLLVIYAAAFCAMAHFRVMEVLLSPGEHSLRVYVAIAMMFLLLRFTVIVIAPGWFFARIFVAIMTPARTIGIKGDGAGPASRVGDGPQVAPGS